MISDPLADLTVPSQIERPPDLLAPGELLAGSYEICGLLGTGGMGQVYDAFDRGLQRAVAIKVQWPHIPAESLHREAQVLAAFRHSGLVTAYALGKHRALEFLVMERISGSPLSEHLRRHGPFPVGEAIELLVSICDTLAVLHNSGLAHADLKPANIMLAAGGRVVLLDLGIARIEQVACTVRLSGSPHFMAPETINGRVRPGEAHLVDIYAAGVIGYMLLTGRAPFHHRDPLQILLQHLEKPAPRVSLMVPSVPHKLDDLLVTMMAKDPADRPAMIELVRDELMALGRRRESH